MKKNKRLKRGITRRQFMGSSALGAVGASTLLSGVKFCKATEPDVPNILLIFPDQLRPQALACYGNTDCSTPNISALSNNGVTFDIACSTFPVCGPARASLMTGLFPHFNGVVDNPTAQDEYGNPILDENNQPIYKYQLEYMLDLDDDGIPETGVPRMAKRLGNALYNTNPYTCTYVGKWHLGGYSLDLQKTNPLYLDFITQEEYRHGYEYYLADTTEINHFTQQDYQECSYDRYWPCFKHGPNNTPMNKTYPVPWRTDYEKNTTKDAISISPYPWFITYASQAPHFPYYGQGTDPDEMPAQYFNMYDPATLTLRPGADSFGFPQYPPCDPGPTLYGDDWYAYYYGYISWFDAMVGEIVTQLKGIDIGGGKSLYDNTLIVFASDHGIDLGCHNNFGKRSLYEESCRVPLIFGGGYIEENYPGRKGTRVTNIPVGLCDIFFTLADFAGTYIEDIRSVLHGDSMIDYVLTGTSALNRDSVYMEVLPTEHTGEGGDVPSRGIRTATHKYIERGSEFDQDGKPTAVYSCDREIYDLVNDPYEQTNINDTAPIALINNLKSKFDYWKTRTNDDWPNLSCEC